MKGRTRVFVAKVDTKNDTFDTKTRVERRKNGKWKSAKRLQKTPKIKEKPQF